MDKRTESMSSEEEELPNELCKLEISTAATAVTNTLPQVKLMDSSNLPLALNPFYAGEDVIEGQSTTMNDAAVEQNVQNAYVNNAIQCHHSRYQKNRRCRVRRRSESVLDDYKIQKSAVTSISSAEFPEESLLSAPPLFSTPVTALTVQSSSVRSTARVAKQSLKKTSHSANSINRRIVIREPILQALRMCFHPQSNVRRKILECSASSDTSNNSRSARNDATDFRELINECQTLLEQDVDFNGRLKHLTLASRNPKNFTAMQIPHNKSSERVRCNSIGVVHNNDSGAGDDDQFVPLNTLSLSLPVATPSSSTLSPEAASSSRSGHTRGSCSQQAGYNGTSPNASSSNNVTDDVTIDELASYFDTFVHIPKKMSSMAEMMYI